MKEVFIVRYADDFKLFCKCRSDAERIFTATTMWLKERLGLEISPEKSKIVNLKKGYSDFLGFKLKLRPKSGKWVLKSHMADKAQKKCRENIREAIGRIGREPNQWSVMQFNAMVLGLHEYYKIATNVYLDFDRIAFDVRKTLLCRTKSHRSKTGLRSQAFQQFYGDFTGKIFNVAGLALFPINGVKTTPPMCFSTDKIALFLPDLSAAIQLCAPPRRTASRTDELLLGGISQHRLHGGHLRRLQFHPRLQHVCAGGGAEPVPMEGKVSGHGVGKPARLL